MVNEKIKTLSQPYSQKIQPITSMEVKSIIKTLPWKKALDHDEIPNRTLRHASNRIFLHLTKIFNNCKRLTHLPTA